ncbi:MAG: AAA family ATPase, partial [Planctomycetia bacterium]|nr:AAA family ATPase [Planctomycetia bacterium]
MTTILPAQLDGIPAELRQLPQWCLWKIRTRRGKPTKVPYQINGREAKPNDPSTWTTFAKMGDRCQQGYYDGPGFVFQQGGGLVGIDLDGCRDPETGEIAEWAKGVVGALSSYSEVSPSGSGVKLWVRGESPFPSGKNRKLDYPPMGGKPSAGIEIYSHGRYFAVTGLHLDGTPTTIQARDLAWLRDEFWPELKSKPVGNHVELPRPSGNGDGGLSVPERARRYVEKMPAAISGQGGHNQTFSVACALVKHFALSPDEAFPIFAEYNARCEPPWTEAELRHKLAGALEADGEVGRLRDARPERSSGGGGKSSTTTPSTPLPVSPGTVVYAADRGNYGEVVEDRGASCRVRFVNPAGGEATVTLDKALLATQDGRPLDGVEAAPLPPVVSLTDIVATFPKLRPPVLPGLRRRGETATGVAAPTAGKSGLAHGLALSVASGMPWLDTFPCEPGRVLLIDGELHPE